MSIGDYTFYNTNFEHINLTGCQIYLLGISTFANCYRLRYLFLPKELQVINSYCFQNCRSLMEFLAPSNLSVLKEYAFASCHSLEVVKLNQNMTKIERFTFYDCKLIETLILPSYITVKTDAFKLCSNLKYLEIGKSCVLEEDSFPINQI